MPFCRKLRVRVVFRTRTGAIDSCFACCCLLADKRGGLGGGATEAGGGGGERGVAMGQLLEFSEPLSEIVSELMLFLRCDFAEVVAGFAEDLLVPHACALPVQPR